MSVQAVTSGLMSPAIPAGVQLLLIIGLSIAVGVLICLLIMVWLLPSLVRAQCAELLQQYESLVRPASPLRVIVLDGNSRGLSAAPAGLRRVHRSAASGPPAGAAFAPVAAPDGAGEVYAQHQEMFGQVYQNNLRLLERLARRAPESR